MPFPFKLQSRAFFFDRSRALLIIINSRIELDQNNYERYDMCLTQIDFSKSKDYENHIQFFW